MFSSKGPVFFRAKRVGKNNKPFWIYKFRTMINNASKLGPPITINNDERITQIGQFLRRTKLDELPQLLNVLKGDMSFVGPRPEDPGILQKYSQQQKEILNFKPGITSPASIFFRKEEALISSAQWQDKYTQILSIKISTDLAYLRKANFGSDLRVIFQTIFLINKKINHKVPETVTKGHREIQIPNRK